jgi:hypothetical protein
MSPLEQRKANESADENTLQLAFHKQINERPTNPLLSDQGAQKSSHFNQIHKQKGICTRSIRRVTSSKGGTNPQRKASGEVPETLMVQ